MTNTILLWKRALALATIATLFSCAPQQLTYVCNNPSLLDNSALSALCLPVTAMHVEYIDNTKLMPDTQFTDTFLLNAASGLLLYEVEKKFKICSAHLDSTDSLDKFPKNQFSVIAKDSALKRTVSQRIQELAAKYNGDLIVVPYIISVKQCAVRPKSWRRDNGPGYERAVSYTAQATAHIQIWDKNGQLLYERIGKSAAGQPIFYSFLKKKTPDRDIVKYAKRLYAAPLVKSLHKALSAAMVFNRY